MKLEDAVKLVKDHIEIGFKMIKEGWADGETYQIPHAVETVLKEMEKRADVVRCKDCKHYSNREVGWCEFHSHFDKNMEDWNAFNDDDYCSYGEISDDRKID